MSDVLEKVDISHLTALDKRRLRDALDTQLRGVDADYTDMELAVWEAICGTLHIRQSLDTFLTRTKYGKRAYADDVFQVEQFITDRCGSLTKNQRMSVLATTMRCMTHLLAREHERGLISPRQLLENSHLVEQAVDDQFPGYPDDILRSVLINAPRA
jgi:hypothetical protein